MPTITIHAPHSATCMAILASLMHKPDLTITISTDSGVGILIGGPSEPTAARAATSQHHPVIDAVMSADHKRDFDRAKKAWVRDNWDHLTSVPCAACKVKAYEACKSPSGRYYGTGFVHNDRLQALSNRKAVRFEPVTLDEM